MSEIKWPTKANGKKMIPTTDEDRAFLDILKNFNQHISLTPEKAAEYEILLDAYSKIFTGKVEVTKTESGWSYTFRLLP